MLSYCMVPQKYLGYIQKTHKSKEKAAEAVLHWVMIYASA